MVVRNCAARHTFIPRSFLFLLLPLVLLGISDDRNIFWFFFFPAILEAVDTVFLSFSASPFRPPAFSFWNDTALFPFSVRY